MSQMRDADISDVDAFLAGEKRLQQLPGLGLPNWGLSNFNEELAATWNIEDELGVVVGRLQFRCGKIAPVFPSMTVVFRRMPVWRLDIEADHVSHPNPPWAEKLGLPPLVAGSHEHSWEHNREYLRKAVRWELPARQPIPGNIKKLSQALPWLAERINLELDHGQRGFEVPPQAELGLFQ